MPISSVNFGRWLERLGFKLAEQPIFNQSVTPVAIVANHEQLVSPTLGPAGMHGGAIGAGATQATVQFTGPSPAWIKLLLTNAAAVDLVISIDSTHATLAAMAAPVVLPRQVFRSGGDVVVTRGTLVGAPSTDLPLVHIGPNSVAYVGELREVFKPAGGWVQIEAVAVATGFLMCATVYELPTENAQ